MTQSLDLVPNFGDLINSIRSQRGILDYDFAKLYGVPTKAFNQAIKRNAERFSEEFMFQLTKEEAEAVLLSRSQFATLKRGQNIKYLPKVFTEHGALMAANVRNSPQSISMSNSAHFLPASPPRVLFFVLFGSAFNDEILFWVREAALLPL